MNGPAEFSIPKYTVHDVGSVHALSQLYPQNVKDYDAPTIWKSTRGKGVVVMVIDSGCPKNHRDLAPNLDMPRCRSFVAGEDIYDTYVGHSTHCCGTIGAVDNSVGIVGIAPEVTLITAKVLNKYGSCTSTELINSLRYAQQIKPDVINLSLGSENSIPGLQDILRELVQSGTVIIGSSGNNGENKILYPAAYDEVIAVGSYKTLADKQRSTFSSWGPSLDIMGPGEEILSTYLNEGYAVLSGTSMAAPSISGIVALLIAYYKSKGKRLTVDEVKALLYVNVVDVGDFGRDDTFGWGFVNSVKLFSTVYAPPKMVSIPKKPNIIQKFFKRLFKRR